ncbi:hypothetical protein BDR06DRAFT_1030622, partial [Suillus hirtellus]
LQGSGPNAFHIHGALYHFMGSLMPPEGVQPSYAQLYIYDTEKATEFCTYHFGNKNFDHNCLRVLYNMLFRHHPYASLCKQAYQVMHKKPPEQHTEVQVRIHFQQGTDGQRYNLPTANEIAAILPGV